MRWKFSKPTDNLPSAATIRLYNALLTAGVSSETAIQIVADNMAVDVRINWLHTVLVYNTILLVMITFDIIALIIICRH